MLPNQEEELTSTVNELEQKNNALNREELENRLNEIEIEHKKIEDLNSAANEDQSQTEEKAQQVRHYTDLLIKIEADLKSLSEETIKSAKKK